LAVVVVAAGEVLGDFSSLPQAATTRARSGTISNERMRGI
jgi:hypothetical protein